MFRYYYNCKTEVSQWEKPRDWADFERSRQSSNVSIPIGLEGKRENFRAPRTTS